MFFNFFLFSLIAYNSISNVGVELFNDFLNWLGFDNIVAIEISSWPKWLQLLLLFILADFIQWTVHILLHRVPWLWEFHKVHHSVKEMGFAAHLRFHWMEKIIYNTIQYIPLAMIGFGLLDFFFVHIIALLIGHLNHANLGIDYGPFRYILNNPKMHIWHHAKKMPNKYGVNYGISLSLWDYLFGTAHAPSDGRDIEIGFDGEEDFPQTLGGQLFHIKSDK
jgi:sterol desaturase/sphingolipid hydroxylase (fatty acid hydroxylase superfamily)